MLSPQMTLKLGSKFKTKLSINLIQHDVVSTTNNEDKNKNEWLLQDLNLKIEFVF